MEKLRAYFWVIFFTTLIGYSAYIFGYLHLYKGKSLDEILGPVEAVKIARLTETSAECIRCHGLTEIRGKKEIKTPWGTQTWQGYEATYIDPHAKVTFFKIKKTSDMGGVAWAGTYDGLGNHPVGIPYPIGNSEYKNPPQSPISIPNGYVECESCHSTAGIEVQSHGELVMDNRGSALCLGCHNK